MVNDVCFLQANAPSVESKKSTCVHTLPPESQGMDGQRKYKSAGCMKSTESEGRKDRHRVRECPKGCGWTGVKLERHLEVHHDVEPKSQAMAKLKANSKALSREEQSIKRRAEEETCSASSKKKKRKETRHVRVNKNTMTLLKRANKIRKKLSIVLMSSSESEQEDGEADEIVETVDRQNIHSDSAPSADEEEVSVGIYGQNDGTDDDNEEEETRKQKTWAGMDHPQGLPMSLRHC